MKVFPVRQLEPRLLFLDLKGIIGYLVDGFKKSFAFMRRFHPHSNTLPQRRGGFWYLARQYVLEGYPNGYS
jgi:hypothetical protein